MVHNWNDGHNPELKILIQPNIGLDSDARRSIVEILNINLADEVVLTTKIRSAHWNVRGANFFELHTLFEDQYQLLNSVCDEIAERARIIGGSPIGSLEEFLKHTRLEEQAGEIPNLVRLLADFEASVRFLRDDARKCAEEYEDEGTLKLLVKVMGLHEKMAWMLRSFIDNQPIHDES